MPQANTNATRVRPCSRDARRPKPANGNKQRRALPISSRRSAPSGWNRRSPEVRNNRL
ncbi:hypothetical protein VP456E521_P0036 [Vibrio phage 456E52-1]|nr:hypothetical protein VP456E521_P0036 [Vibrio phage 456E52-1]